MDLIFLTNIWIPLQKQKDFIEEINASQGSCIFGIFLDHALFVGTIKVGPVNGIHLTADIGILIGSVEHHGKGIGTNAIGGLCAEIGETLSLRKINAGVIATNIGSLRAFEKNGFIREGLRLEQYKGPMGTTEDEILLGKIL
jgi:RimJ/RimL family protein N-acetyltransferase